MLDTRPDFENLQNTLLNKESRFIPLIELGIDPSVKAKILGRPVVDPADDIAFMQLAGYDFIKIQPRIAINLNRQILRNTAQEADTHDRAWSPEGSGLITSWEQFESYDWPKTEDIDYSHFEHAVAHLPENMGIIGQYGDIFTNVWELMGFETFAMSIYEQPDLVTALFEKTSDLILSMFDTMADMDIVGALWYSDDIAYSANLMVAPEFLRKHFFPILKHIAKLAQKRNIPFIYHSDGVLWDVMDDIIACGVTALHPIEPKSMDILEVKKKYGHQLCLCGGIELDLLCRGTEQQVTQLCREHIQTINANGGYCLGSSNSIPNYVNISNYLAMLKSVRNYPQ